MRYYIADLHFCHERLNDHMDRRGFESAEAMNDYMIRQWNSRVNKNDDVIILGDLCLSTNAEEVNSILDLLKGRKYLILGNHDKYINLCGFKKEAFEWIEDYKELHDNKRKVILSHYPIMCYNSQYRRNKEGEPTAYMLYGHVHNTFDEFLVNEYIRNSIRYHRPIFGSDEPVSVPCQMLNCFCMFSDYVPLTLDEWIEVDRKRREKMTASSYS